MNRRRRLITAVTPSRELPRGYTKLNYLESQKSSETSYINIPVYPQSNSTYRIKTTAQNMGASGAGYSGWNYGGIFGWKFNNMWEDGASSAPNGLSSLNKTEVALIIRTSNNTTSVTYKNIQGEDTLSRSNNVLNKCSNTPYPIFALRDNNYFEGQSKFRIYGGFQIYKDNVLIVNLITALDPNHRPCMYDTISQQTYYSATGEEFLYG